MKVIFALIAVVLLSTSISGCTLATQSSSESDILIHQPTDEETAGGTTLHFTWLLSSLPTQDGCLVDVYYLPANGLSDGESPEDYNVVQLTIPFGEEEEVTEYRIGFFSVVECLRSGDVRLRDAK